MMAGPSGLADYHVHTSLCKHAEGKARDYKAAARRREIPEICFTDHIPDPAGYDPAHRMRMEQFPSYRKRISHLQDGSAPGVLFGIEADYYEGCETFLSQWLPSQNFDFVLGSVHYLGNWGFDSPSEQGLWETADVKGAWQEYFELVKRLANSGLADAIGHLDLPKKFGYRPSDTDQQEMVAPTLDCIERAGMGIEINTAGLRKPVGEIYPSPLILRMAHDRDIPICFGSDAHTPEEVGEGFDAALTLAREAGYRHYFRMSRRIKELVPLPESLPVCP